MTTQAHLVTRIEGSIAAIGFLRDQVAQVASICQSVTQLLAEGGSVYTCGNGGSAAQALHLAEELIGRYRSNRPPQRALCLNADPTALTCIANDFGFDHIYSRQCQALLTPGDVLIVLSTSGNSKNVVNALQVARERGCTAIGLLGKTGGECAELCDHCLIVPGGDSAHVQEAHMVVIHLICEMIELALNAPAPS